MVTGKVITHLDAASAIEKVIIVTLGLFTTAGLTIVTWMKHWGYTVDYASIAADPVKFGLTFYSYFVLITVPVLALVISDLDMARRIFVFWALVPWAAKLYWGSAGFFAGCALLALMAGILAMENKQIAIGIMAFFATFALLRTFSTNTLWSMALDMSTDAVTNNAVSLLTMGALGLGGSEDIISQQFSIWGIGDDYWTFASAVLMPGMLMFYARLMKNAAGDDISVARKARLAFIGASAWSFAGVMSLTLVAAVAGKVPAYMVPALWGLLLYGGGWGRIWAAITVLGVYGGLTLVADMVAWLAPSKFD